jgi:hypothetical protein
MLSIAAQLEDLIQQYLGSLYAIDEEEMSYKPSVTKWSKKEIVGHLVDSAQTNIRRLIVSQYENEPFIKYDQDKWVSASGYQQYQLSDLINLWYLLNKHFVAVMRNTSPEMAQRKCKTDGTHTLEWIAQDYIKHLTHHLHQVLNLEPVPYP